MKRETNKKILIALLITIPIIVIFVYAFKNINEEQKAGEETEKAENILDNDNYQPDIIKQKELIIPEEEDNILVPQTKTLEAIFVPQAPLKDWDEPWQNACEEAAILNAYYYLENIKTITPEKARDDLQQMIDWELKYFGSHKDLQIAEVAMVIEKYLGYEYKIIKIESPETIKSEIVNGNPVIIPAAGRVLENEHFTPPAPVYHMLTVIGYSEEKIITHDPGTQFGANFEYSYHNFYESIHDFVAGANADPDLMLTGEKLGIVLIKK